MKLRMLYNICVGYWIEITRLDWHKSVYAKLCRLVGREITSWAKRGEKSVSSLTWKWLGETSLDRQILWFKPVSSSNNLVGRPMQPLNECAFRHYSLSKYIFSLSKINIIYHYVHIFSSSIFYMCDLINVNIWWWVYDVMNGWNQSMEDW